MDNDTVDPDLKGVYTCGRQLTVEMLPVPELRTKQINQSLATVLDFGKSLNYNSEATNSWRSPREQLVAAEFVCRDSGQSTCTCYHFTVSQRIFFAHSYLHQR